MKVLVTALLSDYKLKTKLIGITHSQEVNEVILVRRYKLTGLPKVHNINPGGLFRRSRLLYEVWRFLTIRRLLHTHHADVMVGIQMMLHGLQVALAGRLTRTPYVLSVIGQDVHKELLTFWKGPIFAWALRGASAIAIMGPRSRRILRNQSIADSRLFEIQNYQDSFRFKPSPGQQKRWDLLFVGPLIPRKQLHTLIKAVAAVSTKLPQVRLGLLGEGPQRRQLEALTHSMLIKSNVSFLGFDPHVEKYLQASRLFVMTSVFEGISAAAIEAMYCGLPAILTDVGDISNLFVHDYNALLVPFGNHNALVAAITQLLTDDKTYLRLHQGALETRKLHIRSWNKEGQVKEWERVLSFVSQ